DDPFTDILVGGDRSLVRPQFEFNIHACSLGGELHVASIGPATEDIVGVALWYGPGQDSMTTEEQREVGSDWFFAQCSEELKKWWFEHFFPTMERLEEETLGRGFKDSQWSLLIFGVDPEHHRKGIAKTMMKSAEERVKAEGVSIVLETTTDLDLLIYKRMGFVVKGHVTLTSPRGQSPVYQLIKTP
ncbi:hypothetical protein FPV67DRAFT_1726249, partial [Lyophyllum atratum]